MTVKKETPMDCDQVFNVVGLRENGDRVVITENTTHETAECVMSLMRGGSTFVEFLIERADSEELGLETALA